MLVMKKHHQQQRKQQWQKYELLFLRENKRQQKHGTDTLDC